MRGGSEVSSILDLSTPESSPRLLSLLDTSGWATTSSIAPATAFDLTPMTAMRPACVRLAVQILDLSTPAAAGAIAREQCLGPSSPDSTDSTEHPYAQLAGTIQPD